MLNCIAFLSLHNKTKKEALSFLFCFQQSSFMLKRLSRIFNVHQL